MLELVMEVNMRSFISSPPGWFAIYEREGKRMALPIVAWYMYADNRDQEDIESNPDGPQPYGEPIIHGGDGMLSSAFGQGNWVIHHGVREHRSDFRDGWELKWADYIPKTKGILRPPTGDSMFWELV
jgi:hypothetical protein